MKTKNLFQSISKEKYEEVMNLLLYEQHYVLLKDFNKFM